MLGPSLPTAPAVDPGASVGSLARASGWSHPRARADRVDDDKYLSTRDLIQAVPDSMLTAFVPQVGTPLCMHAWYLCSMICALYVDVAVAVAVAVALAMAVAVAVAMAVAVAVALTPPPLRGGGAEQWRLSV